MKKKAGILKRMTCLLLIFLFSINSFAAIVGDNDGSAFITKAEFDALKSSFQSQIDSYNNSIDSKIDGAIASYLAGIKISNEWEVKDVTGFEFWNKLPETNKQGKNYSLTIERNSNKKALTDIGVDALYLLCAGSSPQTVHSCIEDIECGMELCNAWWYPTNYGLNEVTWSRYNMTRYDGWKKDLFISLDELNAYSNFLGNNNCDTFVIEKVQFKPGAAYDDWEWVYDIIYELMYGENATEFLRASLLWCCPEASGLWTPGEMNTFFTKNQWYTYNDIHDQYIVDCGSGMHSLNNAATTILSTDEPQKIMWKRNLIDFRSFSTSNAFGHCGAGTNKGKTIFPEILQSVTLRARSKDATVQWATANAREVDGVLGVYLSDLSNAMVVETAIFGAEAGTDEVTGDKASTTVLKFDNNSYGKGFLVDLKSENGTTRRYIKGFANKVAAQLYLDTQIHSYSVADNNKIDTNWDDTTFEEAKQFDFLPTYDVATSSELKQAPTSTVAKNIYWKQNIYPLVNQPEEDNTANMMFGLYLGSSAASWGVVVFRADNMLNSTVANSDWVTIPASDTVTTRSGSWNKDGVKTEKIDYIVSTGDVTIPTYKISETTSPLYALLNSNASLIAEKPVNVAAGVLCATVNEERTGSKVGLKFKVYDSSGNEVSDTVHWKLSNKMFNRCSLASDATLLASGDTPSNTLVNTPQFNVTDAKNEIWLNCYAETDGNIVKVDTFTIN